MIGVSDIEQAASRIAPYVLKTSLESSAIVSELANCEAFLKMEHLQPTGSFKIRGATNKLLTLPRKALDDGVVAASTGNHGAAVARAARLLGGRAIVYVPENASPHKLQGITHQGAEIRPFGLDGIESEIEARRFADENKLQYISPYNDVSIIAGQGTIGLELAEQQPGLDVVYVSVGGGGLISGVAAALKTRNPNVEIVACSPENSAVMHHSVEAGNILDLESAPTLSDGTAGGIERDTITFDLCRRLVDRWLLIPEEAIVSALRLAVTSAHLMIEGAAALALAALIQDKTRLKGKCVAAIMCGGNISQDKILSILGSR
jgi:threonine dehydratase